MTDLGTRATADDGASGSEVDPSRTRRFAERLMRNGRLAASAAVLASLVAAVGASPSPSRPPVRLADPVLLVGLTAERTEHLVYDAGATRTWASSGDVHSVVVVSGRITVHGPAGDRQVYGHGEGFAAGWLPYRITNETDSVVETLVTFHVRP